MNRFNLELAILFIALASVAVIVFTSLQLRENYEQQYPGGPVKTYQGVPDPLQGNKSDHIQGNRI